MGVRSRVAGTGLGQSVDRVARGSDAVDPAQTAEFFGDGRIAGVGT